MQQPLETVVVLLKQRLEQHETMCKEDRDATQAKFLECKGEISGLRSQFDKFDNKLWAIVVMVALGVLTALIKMVTS